MTPVEAFEAQAMYCDANDAPITAALSRALGGALDRGTATGARVLDWPGKPIEDALPLRLAGGVHALWRGGAVPELRPLFEDAHGDVAVIKAVIARHDAALLPWLDGPPQTNEPGRSAQLMTGLLEIAARHGPRLELLEIGSSAGLNLLIDRFRIDLGPRTIGPDDSAVHLTPEWRGSAVPDVPIEIVSTRGVDIAPIDACDPAQADRLLAYIWADHAKRFGRVAAAIEMLRLEPVMLEAGDATDWIEARLAEPQAAGVTRVLMHSIVWPYLGDDRRARFRRTMEAAGARATAERPLAWVAVEWQRELSCHDVTVRSWPGFVEPCTIARSHAHGFWVERL